jgi:hypothetical protein
VAGWPADGAANIFTVGYQYYAIVSRLDQTAPYAGSTAHKWVGSNNLPAATGVWDAGANDVNWDVEHVHLIVDFMTSGGLVAGVPHWWTQRKHEDIHIIGNA